MAKGTLLNEGDKSKPVYKIPPEWKGLLPPISEGQEVVVHITSGKTRFELNYFMDETVTAPKLPQRVLGGRQLVKFLGTAKVGQRMDLKKVEDELIFKPANIH